jgi:uncharacterized damage-inducible protein DinB
MITPKQLADAFAQNVEIIEEQVNGLTHADSVLQPPFRGNCLNWVLGHIVAKRDSILETLGEQPLLSPAQAARYDYGSEPVTCDGGDILKLDHLLDALRRGQPRLAAGLERASDQDLARPLDFAGRTMTAAGKAFFLYYHDTYHTGQTELLRQLAGKNDKVI